MDDSNTHPIYQQLIQDHSNLSFVIDALQSELGLCETEDWRHPNYPLLLDGLDYICDYPDRLHHPLEEKIFDYLEAKGLIDGDTLEAIRFQHGFMHERTEWLREELLALISHETASQQFLERFTEFLDLQKEHMVLENHQVFPTIAILGDEDWRNIEAKLDKMPEGEGDILEMDRRQYAVLLSHIHRDCAIVA